MTEKERKIRLTAMMSCAGWASKYSAQALAQVIGTTPEFWLTLQVDYDLQSTLREEGERIDREVMPILAW